MKQELDPLSGGVLVVTEYLPPLYGGADIAAHRFFQLLRQCGHSAMLAGSHHKRVRPEEEVYPVKRGRVKIHPYVDFPINFTITCTILIYFFFRKRKQFTLVHCFNGYSDFVYAFAFVSYLVGKKVIIESSLAGADDPDSIFSTAISRYRYWKNGLYIKRRIYRRAHCHISKSAYLSRQFDKYLHILKEVNEVPYFVNTSLFKPACNSERMALRNRLNINSNAMVIAFAGGITRRKGVDVLLEAFLQCSGQNEEMMLVMIGPSDKYGGTFSKSFVDRVEKLNDSRILLTGQLENVYDYLRAADVYVLPSRKEGFPISILEALCCNLWVIGSSIPMIEHVQIEHEVNGFIFELDDPNDLAEKLVNAFRLVQSGDPRIALAGERARSEYSTEVVYRKYLDVYSTLIG